MLVFPALALFLDILAHNGASPVRIRNVDVQGNIRFPSTGVLRLVDLRPGALFDPQTVSADLKKLYATGQFRALEVRTGQADGDSIDVTIVVRERPYVSGFDIDGVGKALGEQIRDMLLREKLMVLPSTLYRPELANRAAAAVRSMLKAKMHPFPDVFFEVEERGSSVRISLKVRPGPKIEIGAVRFPGSASIREVDLLRLMTVTRPSNPWLRWSAAGRYSREDAAADIELARQYYLSRGFASASLGMPSVFAREFPRHGILQLAGLAPKEMLELKIPVVEGPRFQLASVGLEGNAAAAQPAIDRLVEAITTPASYDYSVLDRARAKMRAALGRAGYPLARVELRQDLDADARLVRATYVVDAGPPMIVNRILFEGNLRVPDKFLRREMILREGDMYDAEKLDESIERLNRAGFLQPVRRADAALVADEGMDSMDVIVKVREKERQGVYGTGGTGGPSGGYLGLIYSAFDFFGLGERLSLELDGGAAQSNLLLDIVGRHFLGTPFTLTLSGVHRLTNLNVANLVPGPQGLVGVFRSRTSGGGLSGSYPLTSRLTTGLGLSVSKQTVIPQTSPPDQAVVQPDPVRFDLSQSLAFDSTGGSGQPRGYRVAMGHTWSGTSFLKNVDSTQDYFVLKTYKRDPILGEGNVWAFRLQGMAALPRGAGGLPIERRILPGDELVRGFRGGGLSPWSYTSGNIPQPAGADTVAGGSIEYRFRIRGPLGGAAFADAGWSSLSSEDAGAAEPLRIVSATNRVLRLSTGGELRVQLPGVRQPARFIFSWNPLRLNAWAPGPSGPIRFSDPRRSIRFAFGNVF